MKRVLTVVVLALLAIALVLATAFVSVGGMQVVAMLRGPQLPEALAVSSPETDPAYFREAILRNERGPDEAAFARFEAILDEAPTPQSVDELGLLASRALVAFDNAHSTLVDPRLRRLPIRLHWTEDALIIVKARPEFAELVGQRVVSIGGRAPEDLLAGMPQLIGGGTAAWRRYRSEYFFTAPTALAFLGAAVRDGAVEVRTVDATGAQGAMSLSADGETLPADAFWDFLASFPSDTSFGTAGWTTLLGSDQPLPLYQQEGERLYLLRDLPEQQAIYVRMNGSINDDGETAAQFTDRVLAQVARSNPRNIIVDFRFNRGGDFSLALPLVRGLSEATPVDGQLYLIVGANTFSAGLIAASQFKRYVPDRLTIVGSEVGDRLRFRGEGYLVTLPRTEIEVYVPRAWDDVERDCGWFDDCWPSFKFLVRGVGRLEPDIRVANTWESYRSGRDAVLEAVVSDIAARR